MQGVLGRTANKIEHDQGRNRGVTPCLQLYKLRQCLRGTSPSQISPANTSAAFNPLLQHRGWNCKHSNIKFNNKDTNRDTSRACQPGLDACGASLSSPGKLLLRSLGQTLGR